MTSATSASRLRRASVLIAVAFALTLVFAGSAYAAPGVTNARFSNPVAYKLKSLLTTRFTCDVDTAGTWGRLDILGANGVVKTVYSGPLAIGTNSLPSWNGLDSKGNRLPSASYDWRLSVSKGGLTTVVTGKITVSRIHFFLKGTLLPGGSVVVAERYMVPGNANMYLQFSSASTTANYVRLTLSGPNHTAGLWTYSFTGSNVLKATTYLRDSGTIKATGMQTFDVYPPGAVFAPDAPIKYYITVIQ